jgi:hypothetical protein
MSLTNEIKKALQKKYQEKNARYIYFDECPVGTGWRGTNYMDAFVIAAWPSDQNKRIAFEIKISKSDFLNEFKKPNKRRPALFFSNEFYFVAPYGLLKPEEIPSDCGLMEFDPESKDIKIKITAPFRESIRPNWNFVGALLRNLKKQIDNNTTPRT